MVLGLIVRKKQRCKQGHSRISVVNADTKYIDRISYNQKLLLKKKKMVRIIVTMALFFIAPCSLGSVIQSPIEHTFAGLVFIVLSVSMFKLFQTKKQKSSWNQ